MTVKIPPDTPSWVVSTINKAAWDEGISVQEYIEKYDVPLDPSDWDYMPTDMQPYEREEDDSI